MNIALLMAAGLFVNGALVHSVAGERLLIIPVLSMELPEFLGSRWMAERTLRMAWHLTSVAWLGLAATLVAAAMPGAHVASLVPAVIGVTCGAMAALSIIVTRGRHLFSWVGSSAAAVLIAWGLWN